MMTGQSIFLLATRSANATRVAEQRLLKLEGEIKSIEEDLSVALEQRQHRVKKAREAALAELTPLVTSVRDIAKETAPQRARWASNTFVLGRQLFNELPSSHATIARWHADRLKAMRTDELELEFADAREIQAWPMMGLILNEWQGRGPHDLADAQTKFSIEDLPDGLPGQREALRGIDAIATDSKYVEHIFSTALGQRKDLTEKMHVGRERQRAEADATA